eukprot:TRINITY_DN9403_c0_g10_i1.p1 TRINITY_DN9403_c0_g10~~TRINITY_DN9403_c0_g10_i1.p1  ORF type:complete len:373 (+),score=53.06 TRINITY_DN9403_c0_g10_i1:60-1178(+)
MVKIWVLGLVGCVLGYLEDQCDYVGNILTRHDYAYQVHSVETVDGFNLSIFRITGRIGSGIDESKPAIVMQHGINASPNSFVGNGESSIAFYLANRGFDVWMPSARGTYYSSKHKTLNPDNKRYWDYTFEDLGMKDSRAYLEYIYKHKGQKLIYFGYSQGFMQMLAAFSLDPHFFKEKLRKIVGWGPAARLDLSTNVLLAFLTYVKLWPLVTLDNILGIMHTNSFERESCLSGFQTCKNFRAFCRFRPMFNSEFLPYNNNPHVATGKDASSVKCLQHLLYIINEGGLFRFPTHGDRVPYNLTRITIPLGLFVGEADMLAPPASAKWLAHVFRNNTNFKLVGIYKYLGHATFTASYTQFQHYTDTYRFLIEKD